MTNKFPLVSIVMPVYNAGDFLFEAVKSIQNQTYQNWELIAIDDASKDNSFLLLKKFAKSDSRIKVSRSTKNLGISKTANLAISKAKGQFIARMDADDIAHPQRIQMQLKYLLKHPSTVAVGAQCGLINERGEKVGEKRFPKTFKEVRKRVFTSIPLQQPTLFVNRSLLPKDFVWYDREADTAEEVELLFKFFNVGNVENVPETLLEYRLHNNNTSLKHPKRTFFLTLKARIKAIFRYGYKPTASGLLITLLQTVVVSILPERFIFPLYAYIRGFYGRRISGVELEYVS